MTLSPPHAAPSPANPMSRTVLVYSPQPMSRERATAALADVATTVLLHDLRELADAISPLLVADLDCLDADGFALIRAWLDANPGSKVAFLTTRTDGFRYAAAADITDTFVAKPFLASDLRTMVGRLTH